VRLAALRRRPDVELRGRARLGAAVRLQVAPRGTLVLGDGCELGDGVRLEVAPGARLVVGERASLGAGTWVQVRGGVVELGPHARTGDACRLVAHAGIVLEAGARLEDEVAVLDADLATDDVERPVREQGVVARPIRVGAGALVGPGAALLRGVTVGPAARVTARAVVTRDVPAGTTAEGVPARAGPAEPPPRPRREPQRRERP
jgi:acetyltransferase-like isoleucine patch superfamily enzyme